MTSREPQNKAASDQSQDHRSSSPLSTAQESHIPRLPPPTGTRWNGAHPSFPGTATGTLPSTQASDDAQGPSTLSLSPYQPRDHSTAGIELTSIPPVHSRLDNLPTQEGGVTRDWHDIEQRGTEADRQYWRLPPPADDHDLEQQRLEERIASLRRCRTVSLYCGAVGLVGAIAILSFVLASEDGDGQQGQQGGDQAD